MSDLIAWSPAMSVGVSILDEDHRRIMGLINKLHGAMTEGAGKEALAEIMSGLHIYIQLHFESEESLLKQTNYPEVDSQHEMHEDMHKKTKEILRQFREEPNSVQPVEILLFLKNWWVEHIMKSDMKYADHLAAHGIR